MPAPNAQYQIQEIPLKMVGGTHYGRYPKISLEETWNFIVSDGFLVPYAGYKNVLNIAPNLPGRGIYSSFRESMLIVVFGTLVYRINPTGQVQQDGTPIFTYAMIGMMYTDAGDVYIAENNNGQICLTDGTYVYVYNYLNATFSTSNPASALNFDFPYTSPGYIAFQNGNLIIACQDTTNWILSGENEAGAPDATVWTISGPTVGALQTKPDYVQAAVPVPGGANNLLLLGRNVAEVWQYTGTALFPYQRNNTANSDYGCINPATVSGLGNVIVWIGVNEQSGPTLMVYSGDIGHIEQISTDGIDYTMGNLTNPTNCTGFLYQQDGHLIYQFTFPSSNISYAYDFETKLFSNVTDENLNYHIARQIVYFNNTYYFVSLNGGNLYEFDTKFSNAQYSSTDVRPIPRIRITPPFRLPSQRPFIVKSLCFTIEQGEYNPIEVIEDFTGGFQQILTESGAFLACENGDLLCTEEEPETPTNTFLIPSNAVYMSISRDGGVNFGSTVEKFMNPTGVRKSRFIYQRLGRANDFTAQIRFVGLNRFVVTDGILEVYE